MRSRSRTPHLILIALSPLALIACGGGGDGVATPASDASEGQLTPNGDGLATDGEGMLTGPPRACDAEPELLTTADGVGFVRTPDLCFEDLAGWPYAPHYVELDGLRQAYVDEGAADGPVVLLLHGQPSWSYLYRTMIPVLAEAGLRVIAMDHLGLGRSDKPTDITSYSFLGHNDRLLRFIEALELEDITLFAQDWGSVIGLRVAGLNPDRFARIALGDGRLRVIDEPPYPAVEDPDVSVDMPSRFEGMPAQQFPLYDGCQRLFPYNDDFAGWMTYAMKAEGFHPAEVLEAGTWFDVPTEAEAAYDAPYPSRIYMAGIRVFPSLINELAGVNDEARAGLEAFERPFLTIWAANDGGGLGSCEVQDDFICNVAGAAGQPHARLAEASHFLQDDQGPEIARRLVAFIQGDGSVTGNHEENCEPRDEGEGPQLPIGEDGTGTPCTSDDSCSDLEANRCIAAKDGTGFCTVQGCAPGECAFFYTCCSDCNPMIEARLNFELSACVPQPAVEQLSTVGGCTCE